jgi:hypothetical protein
MTLSIDTISAFIATDETGEGICAFMTPEGHWMPMVAADKARVEALRPIAQTVADASGLRVVLAEFSARSDLEILEPKP